MTLAAHRPCPAPRCRSIGPCPKHQRKQRQDRGPVNAMYDDPRWRRASKAFLLANPYCVCPTHAGKHVPANVVDHKTPHKGDPALFWDESNWQSLTKACHDSWKRRLENHAGAETATL